MNSIQDGLIPFLQEAVSPFHAVQAAANRLRRAGFEELALGADWSLQPGRSYYVRAFGSSLLAFRLGKQPRRQLHLAAAHTDFPCLRVKPHPVLRTREYGTLNVEVYGGMIRSSWLDRPLSLAGKIVLEAEDVYRPEVRLVDLGRPVVTIPHLAIHMNRSVNEGETLNPQKDMLPLFALLPGCREGASEEDAFLDFLAEECGLLRSRILAYELTAYSTDPPCLLGAHQEFLSASRLDNMTSVYACLDGLIGAEETEGVCGIALFDHEEVGSRTKQGAASMLAPDILYRIYSALGFSESEARADISRGFMLSLDVAHAVHPNVPEKNDPTNFPRLGGGVTLKMACSQAYAGDAEAAAVIRGLCRREKIPCQSFLNRSDLRGGSTLGAMLSANMPIRTMDIGVPILAMHSARETMGAEDQQALQRLVRAFFSR